ncbi:MAG: hypothetical protein PGN26_07175 [Xylophilus ampelinus]
MTTPSLPPPRGAATPQAVLGAALAQIESQLDGVGKALVSGDAAALEAAATGLRDIATTFAQRMATPGAVAFLARDAALRARVLGIGHALCQHRTQLARRAAVVSRQLESMMPAMAASRQVTYGPGAAMRRRFG